MKSPRLLLVLALALSGCSGGCPQQFPDEGLLEVPCSELQCGNGADLDGDGRPNDNVWRTALPIPVYVSPELSVADRQHVDAAIQTLNYMARRAVFEGPWRAPDAVQTRVEVAGGHPDPGTVYVHVEPGLTSAGTTELRWRQDGEILTAKVRLPEPRAHEQPWTRPGVVQHELLHALGFAHDPELVASLMFPRLINPQQRVTESDQALLQRIYGRAPE